MNWYTADFGVGAVNYTAWDDTCAHAHAAILAKEKGEIVVRLRRHGGKPLHRHSGVVVWDIETGWID